MRTLICLTLLISSMIIVSEAGLTKAQRRTIRLFKKVRQLAYDYNNEVVSLNSSLEAVEKAAEVSMRHVYDTDTLTLVDAEYTGSQCGPFDLTTWTENYDVYLAASSAGADSADTFNSGTWTSAENGWYHVCSFARFNGGGNANDNTVYVNNAIVAAYGSGITEDWLTTGVCFDTYAATGTTIKVRHESGGSSDCMQNTGWKHNKFTVHTVGLGAP